MAEDEHPNHENQDGDRQGYDRMDLFPGKRRLGGVGAGFLLDIEGARDELARAVDQDADQDQSRRRERKQLVLKRKIADVGDGENAHRQEEDRQHDIDDAGAAHSSYPDTLTPDTLTAAPVFPCRLAR